MMNVALALAWRPSTKDMAHFRRLYPVLREMYEGISIVAPPTLETDFITELAHIPEVKLFQGKQQFENRRYQTVQQALEFEGADYVHYCDGDHALARLDRFPDDWRRSIEAMRDTDCLIIERSAAVFNRYPEALRETERIINLVMSHLLAQQVDLGSGARGFSRRAAEYLIAHANPNTHGVATDAEWVVLLHDAGFRIGTYQSEGAVYEVEDEAQQKYLDNTDQWAKRVALAHLIIRARIDASSGRDG